MDTDALNPVNNRKSVHAVVLAGGSSFGLDAAGGVMRFLEEKGIGRDVEVTNIPNVCAAILFDLKCGDYRVRPDAAMGYSACAAAFAGEAFRGGNFGAGTGATVGKLRGIRFAMKGGIGSAAFRQEELMVGAVAAVNCVGDVTEGGRIIAGTLDDNGGFADSQKLILDDYRKGRDFFSGVPLNSTTGNTVLGCVITNARFDKAGATRLAGQGQNAIARLIRPGHSVFDGDTVFALCAGETSGEASSGIEAAADAVGILASAAMEAAILDAVKSARAFDGYSAWIDRRNS
jgi:L-aminopeptidase/D-esterase-like protein